MVCSVASEFAPIHLLQSPMQHSAGAGRRASFMSTLWTLCEVWRYLTSNKRFDAFLTRAPPSLTTITEYVINTEDTEQLQLVERTMSFDIV